jgi:hypothetical protein
MVYVVSAALVALVYSVVVNHIWEDYFITFRHSQNLCDGNGLVYNVDDRLHGFTSPLGTLLPAVCYFVTGKVSWEAAFWMFRIISIIAFAVGCGFLVKSFRASVPSYALSPTAIALLYVFDVKAVEFSTDGQESAFMLMFLTWGVYLLTVGFPRHWLAGGICWAGLMWTRPDGCVYVAALALAGLIFGEGSKRDYVAACFKSAAVCTLLYLPWFAWAWSYYGSPVPQTVVAKSYVYEGFTWQLKHWIGDAFSKLPTAAANAFQPIYDVDVVWLPGHEWTQWFLITSGKYLGWVCLMYWLLPVNDRLGRLASFCFAFVCLYFSTLTSIFPWYFPPLTVLGLVVLVRVAFTLADVAVRWYPDDVLFGRARGVAFVALALLLTRQLAFLGLVGWQMRIQQDVIEMGHRKEVGLWLKANMRPNDRIMLEPFGYIGYFSGGRIMDWPGLVSREVTDLRKEKKLWFPGVAAEIQPEWIILRPEDIGSFSQQAFFRNYALVRVFDATGELSTYTFRPGPGWLRYDAIFCVFKKLTTDGKATFDETSLSIPGALQRLNGDSYFVYDLPRPQFVSAIRASYSFQETAAPALFRFQCPGLVDYAFPLPTEAGEHEVLFWIDQPIANFRIGPDVVGPGLKIREVQILTPKTP